MFIHFHLDTVYLSKLSCGCVTNNYYILMSKYYSNDVCISLNGISTLIDSYFLYARSFFPIRQTRLFYLALTSIKLMAIYCMCVIITIQDIIYLIFSIFTIFLKFIRRY